MKIIVCLLLAMLACCATTSSTLIACTGCPDVDSCAEQYFRHKVTIIHSEKIDKGLYYIEYRY